MPDFDAADEWGVMVSPELPCAYGGYFDAANATGNELYLASWASYIATLRNHPSMPVRVCACFVCGFHAGPVVLTLLVHFQIGSSVSFWVVL